MIELQIAHMSRAEKVMAMEVLWQDLAREDDLASPAWHGTELAATKQQVASGLEQPVDWELAKKLIQSSL